MIITEHREKIVIQFIHTWLFHLLAVFKKKTNLKNREKYTSAVMFYQFEGKRHVNKKGEEPVIFICNDRR